MKTKLLFLAILLSTSLFTRQALAQQKTGKGIGIAVITGGNFNKFTGKTYSGEDITGYRFFPGFHVGANIEIPAFSGFYLQSGLQLIKKGAKITDTFFILGKYTATYNLYYAEIPIRLVFKQQVGHGKIVFGAGPDVAFGLGGNWKRDSENSSAYDVKGKIKFRSSYPSSPNPDDIYMKPVELSISVLAGYEFSENFLVRLQGQLGLTNNYVKTNSNDPNNKTKLKNIGFGLSLGYRLGKNKK